MRHAAHAYTEKEYFINESNIYIYIYMYIFKIYCYATTVNTHKHLISCFDWRCYQLINT